LYVVSAFRRTVVVRLKPDTTYSSLSAGESAGGSDESEEKN